MILDPSCVPWEPALRVDGVDADAREDLPMTVLAPVSLALLLLEDDDLLALLLTEDRRLHGNARDSGSADTEDVGSVGKEEHVVEHVLAVGDREPLDQEH